MMIFTMTDEFSRVVLLLRMSINRILTIHWCFFIPSAHVLNSTHVFAEFTNSVKKMSLQ